MCCTSSIVSYAGLCCRLVFIAWVVMYWVVSCGCLIAVYLRLRASGGGWNPKHLATRRYLPPLPSPPPHSLQRRRSAFTSICAVLCCVVWRSDTLKKSLAYVLIFTFVCTCLCKPHAALAHCLLWRGGGVVGVGGCSFGVVWAFSNFSYTASSSRT
jgi:hypothetical protein